MIVDPTDPETIREFFIRYEGLANPELAMLAGCNTDTIRRWKQKCGLVTKPDPFNKVSSSAVATTVTPPENWDCREWFAQQYENMGVVKIGKLIGQDKTFVFNRLKKYKIQTKPHHERVKSNNPCCSEEWLHFHYASRSDYLTWCHSNRIEPDEDGGMGLSLEECASLAGTVPYTIMNWLVKFKMKVRNVAEAQSGERNHSFGKKMEAKTKRVWRDEFFSRYRAGKVTIMLGKATFSNGRRVDQKEIMS